MATRAQKRKYTQATTVQASQTVPVPMPRPFFSRVSMPNEFLNIVLQPPATPSQTTEPVIRDQDDGPHPMKLLKVIE